jgi:hypothetical protein
MHGLRRRLFFAAAASSILSIVATLFAQQSAASASNQKTGEKPVNGMEHSTAPEEVIEILTIDLKPGRRDEFHKVYETRSLPLLKKWNFYVVAYGPSLHDANSYYVVRRFKNLQDREKSEGAFYGSDDWKRGPRDAIMGLVEHFAYTVVSIETWRKISTVLNATENQ